MLTPVASCNRLVENIFVSSSSKGHFKLDQKNVQFLTFEPITCQICKTIKQISSSLWKQTKIQTEFLGFYFEWCKEMLYNNNVRGKKITSVFLQILNSTSVFCFFFTGCKIKLKKLNSNKTFIMNLQKKRTILQTVTTNHFMLKMSQIYKEESETDFQSENKNHKLYKIVVNIKIQTKLKFKYKNTVSKLMWEFILLKRKQERLKLPVSCLCFNHHLLLGNFSNWDKNMKQKHQICLK